MLKEPRGNKGGIMRRFVTIFAVMAILLTGVVRAEAQDVSDLESLLPRAAAIGQGWQTYGPGGTIEEDSESGRAGGVYRFYVGPKASRIIAHIVLVSPGLANAVAAVGLNETELRDASYSLGDDPDALGPSAIQQLPSIPGCDKTFRAAGRDPYDRWPVGMTACVTGTNAIVYVVATGWITPPGETEPLEYHEASDFVAEMIAEAINDLPADGVLDAPGTPEASPVA